MKISPVSFDESAEPLLAKVVTYLRRQGTLQRVQKQALIAEAVLDAVLHDPAATQEDRLLAIAFVKSNIAAKQSILVLMEKLEAVSNESSEPKETSPRKGKACGTSYIRDPF